MEANSTLKLRTTAELEEEKVQEEKTENIALIEAPNDLEPSIPLQTQCEPVIPPKIEDSEESIPPKEATTEDLQLEDPPLQPLEEKFEVGEEVYVEDRHSLWEAKILRDDGEKGYFVHFKGWNSSWDSHKKSDVIYQKNKENTAVFNKNKQEKASRKRAQTNATKTKRKKQKKTHDKTLEKLKFEIPKQFKQLLQEDYHRVHDPNLKQSSFQVTRGSSVDQILQDFRRTSHPSRLQRHIPDMVKGFGAYFDQALTRNLLYKNEKKMVKDFFAKTNHKPKEVCGLIYLLRLLVKLPELASLSHLEEEHTQVIRLTCQGLVRFLKKHLEDYREPDGSESTDGGVPFVEKPQKPTLQY